MYDVHLDLIKVTEHGIEPLYDDFQIFHSAPYRRGPKTREFENPKIDKMIEQKVIEPEQTKRIDPIVFKPKNRERCGRVMTAENIMPYQNETRVSYHP